MKIPAFSLLSTVLALAFCSLAHAQPSGGPYGPQAQTYEVPKNAAHVYYVAPDGKADASGTDVAQPTTLEKAIERVVTGDAIILRGGEYRTGGLLLNQGITIQPYGAEQPVIKGTQVADKWEKQRNGLWRTTWSRLFPAKAADWWRRPSHGHEIPPWLFNNDMVFVDGRFLNAVGWEGDLDENSYYIDYETGSVYLSFDPTQRLVEITAHDSFLVRTTKDVHGKKSDRKGPAIRGLTLTQYAYRALEVEGREPERLEDPSTFGKDVVGTILENLTISFCSRVAGYFRGDNLVIRNCLVSDTSTEGIYVISSADVLLERNIILRNNIEKLLGYYPSAVKIFNQSYRTVCRDNLVMEQPNSNGIWYDVGNVDGKFYNNWIQDSQDGFFFEISKGAICAGNVFVRCENGVRALNSSNVHVYQNTFVNTRALFQRNERSAVGDHFGWHPSTGPDVDERVGHVFVNNFMYADASFPNALVVFDQPSAMCARLQSSQVKQMDSNVYVRAGSGPLKPLIQWMPAANADCKAMLTTPQELTKLQPTLAVHDQYLPNTYGAFFRGKELQHYELRQPIAGWSATALPAEVTEMLGRGKQAPTAPGAYPVSK